MELVCKVCKTSGERGIDKTGVSWCCVDFCWFTMIFVLFCFVFWCGCCSVSLTFCLSFGDCIHLRQKETADKLEKSEKLAGQPDEEKTNRFLTYFLDINCGGVYEDGTGTISSPGFPNGYANNLDCTWLIYRTKETAEFIFLDFATESNYDVAIITSGR